MIKVTRFNASVLTINAELIECIEETPDTVITLVTGKKILVKEPVDTVVERVMAYRQQLGQSSGGAIRPAVLPE